jgi:hypothetical protein
LRNLIHALIVFGCVASLTACGALPKPFAHSGSGLSNPLVSLTGGGAVRISVDKNLPVSLAKPFSDNMIKSLWAENVPASAATNFRPRYLLEGQLNITYASVSEPEQVEVIWTLSNARGQILNVFDHRLAGDRAGWLFLDKELLGKIVADMGKDAVRLLYAQQNPKQDGLKVPQAAKKKPPKMNSDQARDTNDSSSVIVSDSVKPRQKPKIFLSEVIGAPGDGNITLHRNMQRVMRIAGVNVVSERPKSNFLVKGFVNVSPPYNGSNDIAITWLVTTKEGRELGKATQNNRVPAGSLNGRWGDVAYVVAQGGSIGIIDIVEQDFQLKSNKNGLTAP